VNNQLHLVMHWTDGLQTNGLGLALGLGLGVHCN